MAILAHERISGLAVKMWEDVKRYKRHTETTFSAAEIFRELRKHKKLYSQYLIGNCFRGYYTETGTSNLIFLINLIVSKM